MILVDSCVIVDSLRKGDGPAPAFLRRLVNAGVPVGVEPHVIQEVLQGARNNPDWRSSVRFLASFRVFQVHEPVRSHIRAARIYFDCRRRGFTVRSLIDCIVAQTALEHELSLLTDDRDYDGIATVRPLRVLRAG